MWTLLSQLHIDVRTDALRVRVTTADAISRLCGTPSRTSTTCATSSSWVWLSSSCSCARLRGSETYANAVPVSKKSGQRGLLTGLGRRR
ncbi:hypothetical protein A0H81_05587 [Grifola frondosa]|uniref:Uncharacterized protein n=1 Tax=Grifola frondosa TaxID=5627 RepID=A0A1C7MDN1_GRIFR|nr:hypothetical protein A0H81_05587 [Grifola frondosa]